MKFGEQGQRLGGLSLPRLAPQPIVVGDWEQATIFWYFQLVEGYRPDMTVVYPIDRLREAEATGRPVYLARALPGIGLHHHLTMAGPLIALLPAADATVPADALATDIVFSHPLALAGYR